MKREKTSIEVSSTIASSILTYAISVFGNGKLIAWWQYLLAVVVLLGIFLFFFIAIEIVINVWRKYFKRANIKADLNDEIDELERYIKILYEKHCICKSTAMNEYKNVLIQEISVLYHKATNKIGFIERFSSSLTLKDKFVNVNKELMNSYKQFCDNIKSIYHL